MSCSTELSGIDPAELTIDEVRRLMELAVRGYGRLVEADAAAPVLSADHRVTATEAARAASALLHAVNLEVFELALWETWGGRPWRNAGE